jgi:hypothetical protein
MIDMGILKDIGEVIIGGVLGGPAGAISVFTVEHGTEVVEGTIDVARQIVEIGTDVYRAIPLEAFALGDSPLHGLLKHEFEDELILLGQIAGETAIFTALSWPVLGPIGASAEIAAGLIPAFVSVGSIIGKLHHRLLNDQEFDMAQYVFRDSLMDRDEIILTNLGGGLLEGEGLTEGSPFTLPSTLGPAYVNLGRAYVHNATIPDGPLLLHELTHVWQAKQRVLKEIFLHDAIPDALRKEYDFDPQAPNMDRQWNEYGTEQQASIVEAWALGATSRVSLKFNCGARRKFTIGSLLFRYINANVRRSDDARITGNGRSLRQLLADGGHRSTKDMHREPPPIWWEQFGFPGKCS